MCITPLFAVAASPGEQVSVSSADRSKPPIGQGRPVGSPRFAAPAVKSLDEMTPIVSVHLVDADVMGSLRRRAPNPAEVAGLRSASKVVAAPFAGTHLARPQASRGGIIAFWEDTEALDDFLLWHPLAEDLNRGWTIRMQPLTASGAWSGLRVSVPDSAAIDHVGLTAALTIGNVKPMRFGGLSKRNTQIERQILRSPGFVWGTALAGPPRLLATVSIWESSKALTAFARHGAHLDGIRASVPKNRVPGQPAFADGTTYFDEAAFIRCRPFGASGHLSGRNPMPCIEVPAGPLTMSVGAGKTAAG